MALWHLIPTCDDAMSCYTLIGFIMLISINVGAYTMLIRWLMREIKRIDEAIDGHNSYIDDTAKIINQMSVDIAVTRESIVNIESAVTETKTAVAGINKTMFDKLTEK